MNNKWQEIEVFPSFNQMLQPYMIKHVPQEERRIIPLTYEQVCDLNFLGRFDNELLNKYYFGLFGDNTPEDKKPYIANLFNAVFTSKNIRSHFPHKYHDIDIAEFLDYKYTCYGNASGGQFPGLYASFRIVDSDSNAQIYRIGFFGTPHLENDPTWGNRKGTSGIHVAIDNFDMSPHPSIILAFDTCLSVTGNSFSANHNGRITVRKMGGRRGI